MALGVHSEVGRLRKVMVHRPGLEHTRLTPSNAEELLFERSGQPLGEARLRPSAKMHEKVKPRRVDERPNDVRGVLLIEALTKWCARAHIGDDRRRATTTNGIHLVEMCASIRIAMCCLAKCFVDAGEVVVQRGGCCSASQRIDPRSRRTRYSGSVKVSASRNARPAP